MLSNCQQYKQLLTTYRQAFTELEEVFEEFQKKGDLELVDDFAKKEKELEQTREEYKGFAREDDEFNGHWNDNITTERLLGDLSYNLKLDASTSWETINILSKIEGININLTNIKQEHKDKITEWKGSIVDRSSGDVSYQKLENVGGDLYACNAKNFNAPNLESVSGYLRAYNAKSFNAENLTDGAYNAKSFSAPQLETVGEYLNAHNAKSFNAENLTDVQEIYLKKQNFSQFFDNPEEMEVNDSFWQRAEESAHKGGEGIILPKATRERVVWK